MAENTSPLLSIVLMDQRHRWKKGDKPQVETYLREIPELSTDREGLLDCIYQEVLLREESGDVPAEGDYLKRFPDLSNELKIQFEVHRHLPPPPRPVCPPRPSELPQIAGFVISEIIGQGGFGVVYRAWDTSLKRTVALKLLTDRAEPGRKQRSRLAEEAQAAARLSHPNIVQIHSVNTHPDPAYFCLEHVEGGTLAHFLDGRSQPVRDSAEFVATLARAVQYAHLCHVVHCDLKPANILLQRKSKESDRGENNGPSNEAESGRAAGRLQDYDAKITDFGLARRLDSEAGLESIGLAGTLPYMAPEQLSNAASPAAPAVDIYALGAILYEMLTGHPPFVHDSVLQVFLMVRKGRVRPPRERRPEVPDDLNAICLKCLETDPARRYSTAQALADDLNLFLHGREVSVRPLNWSQKIVRWCRQNPLPAGLLALLVAVTAISFIVVTAKMLQAERAEQQERMRADELDAALYRNQILLAAKAWESADVRQATKILGETNPLRRSFEWHYLNQELKGTNSQIPWAGHPVQSLAVSPDGKRLALGDPVEVITLVERATGRVLHSFGQEKVRLTPPVFSPDGRLVAAAGIDQNENWLWLWESKSGQEVLRLGPLGGIAMDLVFVDMGAKIVIASRRESLGSRSLVIETWEAATGTRVSSMSSPAMQPGLTAPRGRLSPNGQWLAWTHGWPLPKGADFRNQVVVVDTASGRLQTTISGHDDCIMAMTFSPDSRLLATFDDAGGGILSDVATGTTVHRLTGLSDAALAAEFSPDGNTLASGGRDQAITLWDVATGESVRELRGHRQLIVSLTYDRTSNSLVSADKDNTILSWLPGQNPRSHSAGVTQISFCENNNNFYTVDLRGQLLQFDTSRLHLPDQPRKLPPPALSMAAFPGCNVIATVDAEGRLRLGSTAVDSEWSLITGLPRLMVNGASPLAVTPDGTTVVALSRTGTELLVVDVGQKKLRLTIAVEDIRWQSVACSWNGQQLALTGDDQTVQIWNLPQGILKRVIPAEFPMKMLQFRPGNEELAGIASADRRVFVWSTRTGEVLRQIEGHKLQINCFTYTPDGKRLITGSADRTVKVWDCNTGEELLTVADLPDEVRGLSVSANDRKLAVYCASRPDLSTIFVLGARNNSSSLHK